MSDFYIYQSSYEYTSVRKNILLHLKYYQKKKSNTFSKSFDVEKVTLLNKYSINNLMEYFKIVTDDIDVTNTIKADSKPDDNINNPENTGIYYNLVKPNKFNIYFTEHPKLKIYNNLLVSQIKCMWFHCKPKNANALYFSMYTKPITSNHWFGNRHSFSYLHKSNYIDQEILAYAFMDPLHILPHIIGENRIALSFDNGSSDWREVTTTPNQINFEAADQQDDEILSIALSSNSSSDVEVIIYSVGIILNINGTDIIVQLNF